jgi:outer membrane autotransporter protein
MSFSLRSKILIGAFSLACFTNINLFPSIMVISSSGDDSLGTLSYAIQQINSGSSTNPIEIVGSIIPTLTTDPFTTIATTMTIQSSDPGYGRSIDGNNLSFDTGTSCGINITSGEVIFTEDITLRDTFINITGGSVALAGPIVNQSFTIPPNPTTPNIFVKDAILTLSGDNSSNAQVIELNESSVVSILGSISEDSAFNIDTYPRQGTINIGLDLTLTQTQLIYGPVTINTEAGYTFTMNTLEPGGTYPPTPTPILTLGGSGTTVIPMILIGNDLVIDGPLGGTSGLNIEGVSSDPVTLTLTGVNTYLGNTTVTPSYNGPGVTLKISSDASIGVNSSNSDTVTINDSCYLENYGQIYAGYVHNYGTATLNSSSNVTVQFKYKNYGATYGCGYITGDFKNESGGIYTGCSVSNLTITGNADFAANSLLSHFLDPTGVAALVVEGDLTLEPGSTLQFRPEAGCYRNGQEMEFITTGGTLSGTFSTIDMGTVLLQPNIQYSSNGATLTIQRTSLPTLAVGENAKTVARVVDHLIEKKLNAGDASFCESLILLSQSAISDILDEMQPSLFKGMTLTQENNAVKVQDTLGYRMQVELDSMHCCPIRVNKDSTKPSTCEREKRPFQVWATGMGDALNQNSTNYAGSPQIGYHENTAGVVLGADYRFADCLYAGLLGAYTDSDIKWYKGRGKGDIQSAYTGLYFSALGKMFYGNVSVIGAWSHYDAHRNINLPLNAAKAKNKHGGAQLLSHADTGINFGWKGFTIRPFDSFDYISQTENSYTEKGADILNLSVKKSNAILLRNELGLNFAHCLCVKGIKFMISPKISWVREVRIKGADSTVEFTDTDTSFTVTGFFPNRSLVSPGVSLTATSLRERLTLELYYNGEFNGNYSDHSYGGQIRVGF